MPQTSTLIELINASVITPDAAHPFFVKLVKAQPHLFENKYFVMPLVSQPTIKIIGKNFFKNIGEVDHHIDITSNLPEYLIVYSENSELNVGIKTSLVTFNHVFIGDKDYIGEYFDHRVGPIISEEEAVKQLNQFFEDIANQRYTRRLVS